MASKVERPWLNPWRVFGWGAVVVLLLIPLVAQFPWTLSDYVFAGLVLGIVGGTFELAVRRSGNRWYRGGVAVALVTAFLLVWINGAVGIIGDEDNPANLMFLGVIAMALAGAIVARFQAAGMARAMAVAAAAETCIALVALRYRLGAEEPPGFPGVWLLILFFAITWLLSAALFRKAGQSAA
jgi:hypothetical protein